MRGEAHENMRTGQLIVDKRVARDGWTAFSRSGVGSGGRSVEVEYANGVRYIIPAQYIVRWGIRTEGFKVPGKSARVVRVRRARKNQVVRVTFSDGSKGDMVWDTVLMACEPRYEHFGGLTKESKALTREWADRTFRVDEGENRYRR